ncbi:M48 family metallopeptidase [Pseudoalteromonas sp. MMG022]|uniref:M48 family metallopeptidase n=1 Tax=Pseudoalteromonas sp. MMG022 TaxID=2909978 RepID=UPI001F3EB925|nr:M48 family metallopeptidase [Pseudoalteromonas sp. MMG022]MCF6436646.1 M48 family metallopeptidase [Pseudoalteromonas sp. MMG022]
MQKVTGKLYSAGSNASVNCILHNSNGQIRVVKDDDLELSVPLQDILPGVAIAGQAQDITLPDGSRFLPDDVSFRLTSLSGVGLLERCERHKGLVLSAIFLCPLLLYLVFFVVVPSMAASAVTLLPNSVVEATGRQSMLLIEKMALEPTEVDPTQQDKINALWQDSLNQLKLDKEKYRLGFYRSDFFGANAFALPHGQIVVTDELVAKLAKHPEALRAVLLHEIGHVEHQHSMRIAAQSVASTIALAVVFGDLQGVAELALGVGSVIMQQQFSQDMESQADDYALHNLEAHGYKAADFATALKLMSSDRSTEQDAWSKYLSTHPQVGERIERALNYQRAK